MSNHNHSHIMEYLKSDREDRMTGEPMLRCLRSFRDEMTDRETGQPEAHELNEAHRRLLREAGGNLTPKDEFAAAVVTFDQLMQQCVALVRDEGTDMLNVFTMPMMYGIAACWHVLEAEEEPVHN